MMFKKGLKEGKNQIYAAQNFLSLTMSKGAVQVLAICWLTLPSIQSMIPLVPLLPITIRSTSLALATSVIVLAGFPSMTMGTVLSAGCFTSARACESTVT
jgi:hypothetical protein